MRNEYKLILFSILTIVLFDMIAARIALLLGFSITWFLPGTLSIYFLAAYRATRYWNIGGVLTIGVFVGFVDATIGCKASEWVSRELEKSPEHVTFPQWCLTAFYVMLLSVLISLLAYGIAYWRRNRA